MVFSTIVFLCMFLPITIILYYAMPKALKNYFLLAASLFFYAWGEPKYLLVMLFSIFAIICLVYGCSGWAADMCRPVWMQEWWKMRVQTDMAQTGDGKSEACCYTCSHCQYRYFICF